jgi:hypothetical protein
MRRRTTGNWAEDLGQTMQRMLIWGIACFILVPVLVVGWAIMLFLLIFR